MSQRFGASSLHQRDSRSALFAGYTDDHQTRRAAGGGGGGGPSSASPSPGARGVGGGYGYGYGGYGGYSPSGAGVGGGSSSSNGGAGGENHGYRAATPNKKGQYSDAVLNELESQNDEQVAGILGKVKVLKDMTVAIGDEIRESSALADKMNDSFDATRLRLRGTMNRMLVMAQRSGVSWKWWLLFFLAVAALFVYVWLF